MACMILNVWMDVDVDVVEGLIISLVCAPWLEYRMEVVGLRDRGEGLLR